MNILNLRLPTSLHAELKQVATEEGVSMNQMVLLAITEKLAVRRVLAGQAAASGALRVRQASNLSRPEAAQELREVLARRSHETPLEGDEHPSR